MLTNQPLNLETLRLSSIAKGLISSISDIDNHNYLARGLQSVPVPLQSRIARKYIDRYNQKKAGSEYRANTWLRRTINRLKPRFGVLFSITQNMPLPWHILSSVEKTKKHAGDLAIECVQIALDVSEEHQTLEYEQILRFTYEAVAEHAKAIGVNVPFYAMRDDDLPSECFEIALLKMQCDKWWTRQLKTLRRQFIELLEIATGQVGKDLYYDKKSEKSKRRGISPYSSKQAQREFSFAQASGRQFLEMMELQSSDGEVINLIDAVKSGMANPANRRNELMLRIRETEELADEMGYTGVFYTITCPARFHANASTWSGSTPKDAQNYLTRTWARARSKLNRRDLKYFGVRVVEPHADGCPHWHMMLFMPKHKVQEINAILRWYFIQEDKTELYDRYGPELTRAKVFNKWVNVDKEGTHLKLVEACVAYRANTEKARLFKIYKQKRQEWGFKKKQGKKAKEPSKFYRTFSPRFDAVIMDKNKGSAASYIAKYISKNIDGYGVNDHEDAETGESLTSQVSPVLAWASTWNIRQFQFQGSPSVTVYRELRRMRTALDDDEFEPIRQAADAANWKDYVKLQGGMCIGRDANFKTHYEETPQGNDYAELVKRIKGVYRTLTNNQLITRLVEWTRQLKGTAEKTAAKDTTNVGAADLSWTSGNNCTPIATGSRDELLLDMMGYDKKEIEQVKKDLISGKRIRRNDQIYQIRNGQLQVWDEKAQIKEQRRQSIESMAYNEAQNDTILSSDSVPTQCNHMFYSFTEMQIASLEKGDTVISNGRVYFTRGLDLYSFKKLDLEQPKTAIKIKVTDKHYQAASEQYDLASQYAAIDGRSLPSSTKFKKGHADVIGDLEMARLVLAGEATAISDNDWWTLDMMA